MSDLTINRLPSATVVAPALLAGLIALGGGALTTARAANSGGVAATEAPSSRGPAGTGSAGASGKGHHSAPTRRAGTTRAQRPSIVSARCTPSSSCEADPARVRPGGRLVLRGHLSSGMLIVFHAHGSRAGRGSSVRTRVRATRSGLAVTVPARAISGHIYALDRNGRRSAPYGPIYVVRHRAPLGARPLTVARSGTAFDGQGMWIWHLDRSDGGSLDAIATRARAAGVSTVYIKSSDGSSNYWSQFTASMVDALKSRGLRVCAWQYVYGTHPIGEAALGARAVSAGADCLLIDAEAEYEGRYASAQTYIQQLRARVGPAYPVGLASFPYVDYHPGLPYSVFLGPGAAQYNAPQMYWKEIGTSVDSVFLHTFTHNRIYSRPIFPLGQSYSNPPASQLVRFRALSHAYGFGGLSFWDWEETNASGWSALAAPAPAPPGFLVPDAWPLLGSGAKGDEVVWLQEYLASAVPSTPTDGFFGPVTVRALQAFQANRGLPVSGHTDPATWRALLALAPVAVNWTGIGGARRARAAVRAGRRPHARWAWAPGSARLPAVRDEIPRLG